MKLPLEPPMPDPDSIEKVIQRLREMKPEQNGKYLHWDEC
jgi:hypothetical protein